LDKTSIGIEIIGWGWVTKKDGKYFTYVNSEVKAEDVVELDKPFRGFIHWHKYTQAQIDAVVDLLKLWKDRYNIDISYNEDIWDVTPRALRGEGGVFTHCSVRPDKFDVFPQPELIEALKAL
jgi:N-acetyl-anhydromuramyl-L-alanine amidase AmpD